MATCLWCWAVVTDNPGINDFVSTAALAATSGKCEEAGQDATAGSPSNISQMKTGLTGNKDRVAHWRVVIACVYISRSRLMKTVGCSRHWAWCCQYSPEFTV